MPAPVSFTHKFLHTAFIDNNQNTAGPSQPVPRQEDPIHYSPAKYVSLAAFVQHEDFAKFKKEYEAVLNSLAAFVDTHGDRLNPPLAQKTKKSTKDSIDNLKQRLPNFKDEEAKGVNVYGIGKQYFHELAKLVQDDGIRLQTRVDAVVALAESLEMCTGRITGDLQATVEKLRAAKSGLKGIAHKWKAEMMKELVMEYLGKNRNTHIVTAYYNHIAPRMSLPPLQDQFAHVLTPEEAEAFQMHVGGKLKLKPTHLAMYITETYHAQMQDGLLNAKLDPDNMTDFDPQNKDNDYIKVQSIARGLAGEFGEMLPLASVLEMNEDNSMAYVGSKQPTRGARHFLKQLKQQGLVDYGQKKDGRKSSIVLGTLGEERIKMLDDLLWSKKGVGKDELIEEFPVSSLLRLAAGELLDNIEKAGTNVQERALLLNNLMERIQASLEGMDNAEEMLEPWLKGFAAKLREPAGGSHSGEGTSSKLAWSAPLIHLAAAFDQGDALRELLRAGVEIGARNNQGETALMVAAQKGKIKAINTLIEAGADMEATNSAGETALMMASHKGKIEAIKTLIKAGANKEAMDRWKFTPLMRTAEAGQVEALRAMLDAGAYKDAKTRRGLTPLMLATQHGHVSAMQALLGKGANINARSHRKFTALMIAAKNGHVPALQTLLDARAEKEIRDHWGYTALMRTAEKGRVGALQALLRAGAQKDVQANDGSTTLIVAAKNGHLPLLRALLAAEVKKEIEDTRGYTALMHAAENGRAAEFKALLSAGAQAASAIMKGHIKTIDMLIQHHPETIMTAAKGNDQLATKAKTILIEALKTAVMNGHIETITTLGRHNAGAILHKARPGIGANEYAALKSMALSGHVEAAKMLMQYDPKQVKDFMAAARGNSEPSMQAKTVLLAVLLNLAQENATADLQNLIKAGADKIQDAQGKTALMRSVEMMASDNEQGLRALTALLNAGADTTIHDKDGKTVRDYAAVLAVQQPNPNDQALQALLTKKSGGRISRLSRLLVPRK